MTPDVSTPIGEPTLQWSATAHSIAEIEGEISRMWSVRDASRQAVAEERGLSAARTNVMNLVVIASSPEVAERSAATVQTLTGLHPSRTIVIQSADADGPSWLDARIETHCVLAHADVAETCAETIHVRSGGEAGRHLNAIAAPLIIHDLPVTVWWPGEPRLDGSPAQRLLAETDCLVVDGSAWQFDGLKRLRQMAELQASSKLAISDFALDRQSRWREAIASIFDDPDFLPYLRSIGRIAVTYATHDENAAIRSTNMVKPVYHVSWLASRLRLHVVRTLAPVTRPSRPVRPMPGRPNIGRGVVATLSDGRAEVAVVIRPVRSTMPPGTTLRVELLAERRGSELRADVTAEADTVHSRVWLDGVEALDRHFRAPRRTDADLLAEAIAFGRRDAVAVGALQAAAALVGPDGIDDKDDP